MESKFQKDSMALHWVLDQDETTGFLASLFSDSRAFGNTSIDSILQHLEIRRLWASARSEWQTFPKHASDPEDSYSEKDISKFFNRILDNLPASILCGRRWTGKGKGENKPLNGFSDAVRKPDLILCDKAVIDKCKIKKERQFNIATDVYVIGEIEKRNRPEDAKTSFIELAGKVASQIEHQDGRYAAPGIQLSGTDIVLTFFDRGGSISTHPLNVHKHPKEFLRILLGVTLGDAIVLGFDPTVSPVVGGKKNVRITMEGGQWTILVDQLLFISFSLHGRGTTVWSGTVTQTDFPGLSKEEVVVVKDSFVDPMRRYTEGRVLKILEEHGIQGVPRLIHEQQVQTTHPLDPALVINQSTHILRSLVADPVPEGWEYDLRVLSRLVTTPKGVPIYEFSSLAELLVGFTDCLEVHFDALEKAGILHRDASLSNLLFIVSASGEERKADFLQVLCDEERMQLSQKIAGRILRRGLLADWGYAVPIQQLARMDASHEDTSPSLNVRLPGHSETKMKPQSKLNGTDSIVIPLADEPLPDDSGTPIDASPLLRTGTWAWMAAELSCATPGTPVLHQPYHDLESFFYILVSICLLYDAPKTMKPSKELTKCFDPLFAVTQPSTYKTTAIQANLGWTGLILPYISPYFRPLVPLLEQLRESIILPIKPSSTDGTIEHNPDFMHRTFIEAIVKTLLQLPDSSWIPFGSQDATVASQSSSVPDAAIPSLLGIKRALESDNDGSQSRESKRPRSWMRSMTY